MAKNQKKPFSCTECGQPFATEHGRNTHLRIVHHTAGEAPRTVADSIPPLPQPIEAGGDITTRKVQGLEVIELPDGRLQCPKCISTSLNTASMATHLRQSHGIRMHTSQECPICHQTFSGKGGLSRHMRLAHDQGNGPGAVRKLKPLQTETSQPHSSEITPQVILEIIRIQKEAAINGYLRASDELSEAIRKLINQ